LKSLDPIRRDGVHSRNPDDPDPTVRTFVYSLFGLQIRSNLPIPKISSTQVEPSSFDQPVPEHAAQDVETQDVEIHLGVAPRKTEQGSGVPDRLAYASEYKDNSGEPAIKLWKINDGQFLRLEYFDGSHFWLDREGTQIWATWPATLTLEDAATYLLGPVLGLLLRLRGVTCLHASAVSLGDSAVAFAGSEGAGKSTTAAALAQQGCPVISDDVVALTEANGIFYVYPAYPYLCLWPESTEMIYGAADALPRLSENDEKQCLSLNKRNLRFEDRLLPLKAIYMLGERRSHAAPKIEAISAQQSILALVTNTFATIVLDGPMRAREFETLGRLIPTVKIRRIFAHQNPEHLDELCRLIREDVNTTKPGITTAGGA